eukprot:1902498-Pyramimonas_sp.AAC.1
MGHSRWSPLKTAAVGGAAGAAAGAEGGFVGFSAQLRAAWRCWSACCRSSSNARLCAVELVEVSSLGVVENG